MERWKTRINVEIYSQDKWKDGKSGRDRKQFKKKKGTKFQEKSKMNCGYQSDIQQKQEILALCTVLSLFSKYKVI